ncbi:polysaccharide lyase 6 family protein [Niabella drilacis]|uniref:Chondroitinase B n=1 Tax=Niabella drilacis (strain DSM 25811 / CCM 8410 / CCUG 62505 / LMG 26954 / E90) TaxID=1285928 RepID=A0A1G6I8P9_NIADE|nr:polysaccharide lyase 6 family protein [Niabella drilacis]SDC02919.1 Chondroitinase B [Niabella drilacis]
MKKYILAVLFLQFLMKAMAGTITVASVDELQKAIDNAVPGDVIVLKNGVYKAAQDIKIVQQGTKQKPITIRAESTGGAEISGAGGISIQRPATWIVIEGFKFTHAASKARSGAGTRFCRWTHNVFETPGKGEYLTIAGSDHEIDYNTFQNKTEMGRILAIRGEGKQIAERLHIHHNYFYNFPDQGGANGAETFQFGLSGFSLSTSNSIVEYNLFEKCHGENELISVKASGVTLRYNTIRDCPAQFTLRHGNKCTVYGNYFFNTPGIRIFGDDHQIFSNYFENCNPAITVGNGGGEVADGAALTEHDRPDRVLIAFNTMVNNKKNIEQPGRKNGLGATAIAIVCNIIRGGDVAASIAGPYTSPQWKGNIIFDTKGAGDMPESGCRVLDPKLVKGTNGIWRLDKGSPAIGAGGEGYPVQAVDMDGQPRNGKWDTGADQYSTATATAHALKADEVGALAK